VPGDGGASIDTWKVEATFGPQKVTYWIDKNTRELVQSEIQVAPGVAVKSVR
jgi:hypothetical protein